MTEKIEIAFPVLRPYDEIRLPLSIEIPNPHPKSSIGNGDPGSFPLRVAIILATSPKRTRHVTERYVGQSSRFGDGVG
ncbi:hypothetical protein [Noviherbaspirillum autotrophicum]|uniref:hypothetical protein n=1 Tax=Noviherbaspirillum autotrophicum TaxID=709839 RepID=UPI0012FDA2A1|nr:hypothetical protein [Noviherbaspirillum autotrophicum]